MTSWYSNKILEYGYNGSLVREIPESSGPWQAVELNRGNMVVSSCGSIQGMYVMTLEGEVVHCFGGKPGA